ncbi:flagellar biosynthetic protein FliO [Aerosticca soli]|nr:flagellar biosynthetic protein FliO [Aerosticca soli]MDI3262761.1 flagellar biosynthetic protein FliO [Fulvimonas sp.]
MRLAIAPAAMPTVDLGGELLRAVLGLAAIVALILLAGWLSRRLQARAAPGGRRLRCVESMALGARERVLLLDADGKRLLIGVGAGGVRTLHVYEGQAPEPAPPAPPPAFGELLGRLRRRP